MCKSVDAFFETLGSGLYGVALLEAASEDHFKNVAFLCGKHRGAAPLFGLGDPYLNERYTCENLDSLMNLTYETDSWVEEDFEGSEDDEYFDEDAYMDEIRDEVSPFDPNWPDCSMGQCDMIAASVAAVRWPYYRGGLFWTAGKRGSVSKLEDFGLPEFEMSQYNEAVEDVPRN